MAKWDLSKLPEGRKPLDDSWFREKVQMQERIVELDAKLVDVTEEFDAIVKHDRTRIEELVSMVVDRDNRIEELELEVETWKSRAIHQNEVAGRLEAKLAKAVDVIDWALICWDDHNKHGYMMQGDWVPEARTTLAELKGGK